jgi:monofunctional glycosyltransferase
LNLILKAPVIYPKYRPRRSSLLCRLLKAVLTLAIAALLFSVLLVLPWRWLPLPTSSFMVQSVFRNAQTYQYRWTGYDRISPYMGLAAIAAEDQQFPKHHGFDWEAMKQAIDDRKQGGELRGASTISQQVAKNLYLWSGQNLIRKGIEAWFTVLIEWMWTKQRILEVYLNIAQFSPRIFGVEAASQHFFSHSAAELNPDEAALLAAVLPGPELYQVDQPSLLVLDRQSWILRQMDQLGGVNYLRNL